MVLCPYNYVLSSLPRNSIALDLQDAIIIFDEGHNIESIAQSSMSYHVSIESVEFVN